MLELTIMATFSPPCLAPRSTALMECARDGALCLLATEGIPTRVALFSHSPQELVLVVPRQSTAAFQVYAQINGQMVCRSKHYEMSLSTHTQNEGWDKSRDSHLHRRGEPWDIPPPHPTHEELVAISIWFFTYELGVTRHSTIAFPLRLPASPLSGQSCMNP